MSVSREDYSVPVEEALKRLAVVPDYDAGGGPEPCVHTFVESAFGLLGAHWSLTRVEESMRRWGVEKSGAMAEGMHHGLVILEQRDGGTRPVFLETVEEDE